MCDRHRKIIYKVQRVLTLSKGELSCSINMDVREGTQMNVTKRDHSIMRCYKSNIFVSPPQRRFFLKLSIYFHIKMISNQYQCEAQLEFG